MEIRKSGASNEKRDGLGRASDFWQQMIMKTFPDHSATPATNSGFAFRPILPNDIGQVATLIRTVMTEFGCVGEGYSINDPEIGDMYHAYNREGAAFYVVENKARILGCGGIAPLEGGDGATCELRKMYFYPELRGNGWGKKMLNHCLAIAKEKGYTRCYLETVARMEQANYLYQKMGFEKSCERFGDTGHGSCERYYVKNLS